MAVPFKASHDLLDVGAEIVFEGAAGTVFQVRPEGYLIYRNPVEGEAEAGVVDRPPLLPHDKAIRASAFGRLVVVRRTSAATPIENALPRVHRTAKEIKRMHFRKAHCQAASDLCERGMAMTRAAFAANQDRIALGAGDLLVAWERQAAGGRRKRAGARTGIVVERLPETNRNGRRVYDWYRDWMERGDEALFDAYRDCGGADHHCLETAALTRRIVDTRLDMERPSIASIVESVQAAVDVENDRRAADPDLAQDPLTMPGRDYVRDLIDEIAPIEHAIRRRGLKVAYKDVHSVGFGLTTTRILERVEIDEYTCDLMVILEAVGLLKRLPDVVREEWRLDGGTRRVTISAAIDVHSRCLVGLKIVPEGADDPLRDTIEMIYLDKRSVSDALGCVSSWHQGGRPSTIVLDRGAKYVTQEAYDLLARLGITNLGAPAGKPWLRAFIERLFGTLHRSFLVRFPGRTFSNVVAKGENDAAARAAMTFETFLGWLARWIVDDYHRAPHSGLGARTPMDVWDESAARHRPQSLTDREMRLAFGTRLTRVVGRRGIEISPVTYNDDAFAAVCHQERLREVEVAFWQRTAGAIEVRIDRDRWQTVTTTEPEWMGCDFTDMLRVRQERNERRGRRDLVRSKFIVEADAEAYRLKALNAIAAPSFSAADVARLTEDFTRHQANAGRDYDRAPSGGLFDDEVTGTDPGVLSSDAPHHRTGTRRRPGRTDIME